MCIFAYFAALNNLSFDKPHLSVMKKFLQRISAVLDENSLIMICFCVFSLSSSTYYQSNYVIKIKTVILKLFYLLQPNLGYCVRTMFEDTDRWWQSSCIICKVFTKWKIYSSSDTWQHTKVVGLQQRKMSENVHRPSKWKILHIC